MPNTGGDTQPNSHGSTHNDLGERQRLSLRHGMQFGAEPLARDGEGESGGGPGAQHQREQGSRVNLEIREEIS